jgi:hypothetical protein
LRLPSFRARPGQVTLGACGLPVVLALLSAALSVEGLFGIDRAGAPIAVRSLGPSSAGKAAPDFAYER